MALRAYALVGTSVLAAVRTQVENTVRAWCADWGVAYHELPVKAERAWESGLRPAPVWRQVVEGSNGQMWLGWPPELIGQLQRLMFPPDQRYGPQEGKSGSMADACAMAALEGLVSALSRVLGGAVDCRTVTSDIDEPSRHEWAYASGAVRIDVHIGMYSCVGLLDHGTVRALAVHCAPEALLPLKPVDQTRMLGNVPVTLHIDAGRAVVSLGSLRALDLGDVIRLDTVTDQPLAVRSTAGAQLFGGHLGLVGRQVALEVVRTNQQQV